MNWLYRLERKFGRLGIPNLMIYITATMLAVYILIAVGIPVNSTLYFSRALILRGEIWRLITFVFIPPATGLLWIVITLYFYYFIGSSLENVWGEFRFTLYYFFGILGAIIAGMISGGTTNTYLNLSMFLAFAQLFPEHQVLLFFIIPIKVKYLAYVNWAIFVLNFALGNMVTRVCILFSLLNFFLFFGPDITSRFRENRRYSKSRRDFKRQRNDYQDYWR